MSWNRYLFTINGDIESLMIDGIEYHITSEISSFGTVKVHIHNTQTDDTYFLVAQSVAEAKSDIMRFTPKLLELLNALN